jgi:hypothetical protein
MLLPSIAPVSHAQLSDSSNYDTIILKADIFE